MFVRIVRAERVDWGREWAIYSWFYYCCRSGDIYWRCLLQIIITKHRKISLTDDGVVFSGV